MKCDLTTLLRFDYIVDRNSYLIFTCYISVDLFSVTNISVDLFSGTNINVDLFSVTNISVDLFSVTTISVDLVSVTNISVDLFSVTNISVDLFSVTTRIFYLNPRLDVSQWSKGYRSFLNSTHFTNIEHI